MFCPNCGSEIADGALFCSSCGFSVGGGAPTGGPVPGAQPGYYQPVQPKQPNLSIEILKRAFAVVFKKPFRLWGLSLMSALLSVIASILGGPVIGIGVAVGLVLNLGMAWIYLDGYRGEEVSSKQLFEPFKSFWKSFAGMGWMELWVLIWSLIPFAGFVFGIIKGYAYGLTPYILREDDKVSPNEALKESISRTNGYKGKMFLTDLLFALMIFVPTLVLSLMSMIPYIGVLFGLILVVFCIAIAAFGGLITGLIKAAWYEEITKAKKAE